jgi:hypothetical protein
MWMVCAAEAAILTAYVLIFDNMTDTQNVREQDALAKT